MATRPTAAKAPQDRQPKIVKPKVEKVETTIGEGDEARTVPARQVTMPISPEKDVVVVVADEALDDFEVLDDIRAAQDQNDASRLPSLLRRIVGDQYGTVLDALRGPNGRVTTSDGARFVLDLFKALNPN